MHNRIVWQKFDSNVRRIFYNWNAYNVQCILHNLPCFNLDIYINLQLSCHCIQITSVDMEIVGSKINRFQYKHDRTEKWLFQPTTKIHLKCDFLQYIFSNEFDESMDSMPYIKYILSEIPWPNYISTNFSIQKCYLQTFVYYYWIVRIVNNEHF